MRNFTMNNNILLLRGKDIRQILAEQHDDILVVVKEAYLAKSANNVVQPPSSFLTFPNKQRERIISLPAYIGEPFNCAGIKWISSFPENVNKNIERASAIYILNSVETGHPVAIMESSIISAKRTAASATLAAKLVLDRKNLSQIAVIGCGLINYETLCFLMTQYSSLSKINLYDLDIHRSEQFKAVVNDRYPELVVNITCSLSDCIQDANLTTIATSSVKPYITNLDLFKPGTVVLHTSLRDLSPEIMMGSYNVVDDSEHACSANTSLHLASLTQSRNLISCTISDLILQGRDQYIKDDRPCIVSPFGLGILDLALANYIYHKAILLSQGFMVDDFLPTPWFDQEEKEVCI